MFFVGARLSWRACFLRVRVAFFSIMVAPTAKAPPDFLEDEFEDGKGGKVALSEMVRTGLAKTYARSKGVSWTTSTFQELDETSFVHLVESAVEFGDGYDGLDKDHRKTDVAWEVASALKWFCVRRLAEDEDDKDEVTAEDARVFTTNGVCCAPVESLHTTPPVIGLVLDWIPVR